METILNQHWHHLTVEQSLDLLGSDRVRGLPLFEIEYRREHFGPNTLSSKNPTPLWMIFLRQFGQPLVYLLLAAGVSTGRGTSVFGVGKHGSVRLTVKTERAKFISLLRRLFEWTNSRKTG